MRHRQWRCGLSQQWSNRLARQPGGALSRVVFGYTLEIRGDETPFVCF